MAAVGAALAGCFVALLALLAAVVHSDLNAAEIRHPMAEDIPRWWW